MICVIQHAQCESPGRIEAALKECHLGLEIIRTFEQQPVPKNIDRYEGLILMGGPMAVYEQDRHEYLGDELRLIEQALTSDKPILGICLGSQLLAAALGAAVTKGAHKEIGWYGITLTDAALTDTLWGGVPRSFKALAWHGDVFDLPSGAIPLASSEMTECQAFRFGRKAYGLLFHIEVTRATLEGMVTNFAEELVQAGIKPNQLLEPATTHLNQLHHISATVFQRWGRLV